MHRQPHFSKSLSPLSFSLTLSLSHSLSLSLSLSLAHSHHSTQHFTRHLIVVPLSLSLSFPLPRTKNPDSGSMRYFEYKVRKGKQEGAEHIRRNNFSEKVFGEESCTATYVGVTKGAQGCLAPRPHLTVKWGYCAAIKAQGDTCLQSPCLTNISLVK
eukprot:sb/3473097/